MRIPVSFWGATHFSGTKYNGIFPFYLARPVPRIVLQISARLAMKRRHIPFSRFLGCVKLTTWFKIWPKGCFKYCCGSRFLMNKCRKLKSPALQPLIYPRDASYSNTIDRQSINDTSSSCFLFGLAVLVSFVLQYNTLLREPFTLIILARLPIFPARRELEGRLWILQPTTERDRLIHSDQYS